MVGVNLMERFCFDMVSTTGVSLSMRGRYKIEIAEGWIFCKTRG